MSLTMYIVGKFKRFIIDDSTLLLKEGRSMTEFIFMLTHHDVTIPNALETLEDVKDTGLRYIGCKDIGLKIDQYHELFNRMKHYGLVSFLEVVTYSEEEHFKGVDLALKIGADNLIGGMPWYTEKTLTYIKEKGAPLKFYPYIGKISDHPCVLEGSIDEIIKDGQRSEALGIDGINLLLYRYKGDQTALLEATLEKLEKPLIVAGNVTAPDQINELKRKNVWAFTIGGAIFEKKFVNDGNFPDQIKKVLNYL